MSVWDRWGHAFLLEYKLKPRYMKRKRNNIYYFLTSLGTVDYTIDKGSKEDDRRLKIGNYFNPREAREVQEELLKLLSEHKNKAL